MLFSWWRVCLKLVQFVREAARIRQGTILPRKKDIDHESPLVEFRTAEPPRMTLTRVLRGIHLQRFLGLFWLSNSTLNTNLVHAARFFISDAAGYDMIKSVDLHQ